MDWIGHIDTNMSAAISAVATAISAASTLVVAVFTAFLFYENRRLRKAGNSPEMVAYLATHPDGHGGVNFILANVGTGPAYDVQFELIGDENDRVAHEVLLANDNTRSSIGVVPQNERITALFGISYVLYGSKDGQKPLAPLDVRISFNDGRGFRRVSHSRIDVKQFAGLAGVIAKPPIVKIADRLGNIEKSLGLIARQSANFAAFVNISKFEDEYVRKAKGAD
ncbi:hypothetical protein [Neoaquamicrobium sediminum]|uniref:hypothetical protein n=1 Tax=Neoaquamicrobium sediminum TaxID=1849104 RepID=UPI003BA9A7C9